MEDGAAGGLIARRRVLKDRFSASRNSQRHGAQSDGISERASRHGQSILRQYIVLQRDAIVMVRGNRMRRHSVQESGAGRW